MLTPASFAALPQRSADHSLGPSAPEAAPPSTPCSSSSTAGGAASPSQVRYVRHARLPCRRVPGPPLVSSAAAPPLILADAHGGVSVSGTASLIGQPGSPTTPTPTTSPAAAGSSAYTGAAASSQPPQPKAETTLQAAQNFLASSGASLLHFANTSLALTTARDAVDGAHSGSGGSGAVHELAAAAQENLMASAPAMDALKERYGASAVEWKRMAFARQQCRYSGEALVRTSRAAASDTAHSALIVASSTTSSSPPAATATAAAGSDAELSAGARFMQSLLHPFVPPTTSNVAPALKRASISEGSGAEASPPIPHGEGVMAYVLYAMPKTDYSPVSAAPFLPPGLIPTTICPPLSELDQDVCTTAAHVSGEESAAVTSRLLLLSLVVFEGSFMQGRRHGRGRLTAYGRFVLECTWVHDVPCLAVPQLPPTLRRIHAHILSASAAVGPASKVVSSSSSSPSWSLQTHQLYMGDVALAAPASARRLAKFDSGSAPATPFSIPSVMEAAGGRYLRLVLPAPSLLSAPSAAGCAFSGLAWVNHVVLLPDGFGEAHHYPAGSTAPAAGTFASPNSMFHPPLWLPRGASRLLAHTSANQPALCTRYCGEWKCGLPDGFGVELVRVTDPANAALTLSSATAGSGPPQYPWRSLFLGAHVRGERCGPGTLHGQQGSEAATAVVCGTWPRGGGGCSDDAASSQALANVVLLPPTARCGVDASPSASSFFFTLQNARWAEEEHGGEGGEHGGGSSGNSGGGGGGTFPIATLRQSPAALSGMWEPLLRAVDDAISQPAAALAFAAADGGAAGTPDVTWQHARQVMDHLVQSPACVSALRAFQACFACMYGCDTTVTAATMPATSGEDLIPSCHSRSQMSPSASQGEGIPASSSSSPAASFLARLRSAGAAAPQIGDLSLGYPWCPTHSWCGPAHLHDASDSRTSGAFAACLHGPLSNGATHQQPTGKASQARCHGMCGTSRRPPLSAVAEAFEPHAAVHTFTHAMHAAAAMVSSLRLRLLSCFAAYPDLCEVVMTQSASEDRVLDYCWDLVYDSVGAILHERAAAVAVADLRMVWDFLGLDQVHTDGVAAATRPGWQPEGRETLRDYAMALRRCRALRAEDVVDTPLSDVGRGDGDVQRCLGSLAACLRAPPLSSTPSSLGRAQTERGGGGLQVAIAALQQLHALLGDSDASTLAAHEVPDSADGSSGCMAPSRREGLLRWLLLAASSPDSHPATSPIPTQQTRHSTPSLGHPFALLLIVAYVLGGRVTPQYPGVSHPSNTHLVAPAALLGLVKEMGCASRQVLHTYPVLRAQTFTYPLVCPVDVLFAKLEYAISPCAAHCLLHPSVPQWLSAAVCASTKEAGPDGARCVHTTIQLDQLPVEVLQWCNEALTDGVTESALQARLHRYWNSHHRGVSPSPSPPLTAEADETQRCRETAPTPSPLVRWVLSCLQSLLSAPIRRSAQRGAETAALPSATTTAVGGEDVYTWRRFTNAVFCTAEEGSSNPPGMSTPLSAMDYVYLVALAYTLRELGGISLAFTAQVVLQDDEDEEDGEDGEASASEFGPTPHRQSHPSSTAGSLRDRRKNIFLSSSSSSSSLESAVTVSLASCPPADTREGWAATETSAPCLHSGSVPAAASSTPPEPSPSPLTPSSLQQQQQQQQQHTPTTTESSPRGGNGRQQQQQQQRRRRRARRGTSALLVDGAVVPLGKEWLLTLSLPAGANTDGDGDARGGVGAAPTLLWEVMERVCARVGYRVQAHKSAVGAPDGELHPIKNRPKYAVQ